MRTLLIIGQAPSRSGNPAEPLEGKTGHKLADLFGCSYDQYMERTQRINLLPEWPGANAKGDKFPMRLARTNAHRMSYSFGGCWVLFLGIGVAKSFNVSHEPLRWVREIRENGDWNASVLPHTSGTNRWWNDLLHREQAKVFMQFTWKCVVEGKRCKLP